MKIFCKHCSASINIDKDTTCPNCGAALYMDEEVREYHSKKNRMEFERDKLDLQNQQLEYEEKQIRLERTKENVKHEKKLRKVSNTISNLYIGFFIFIAVAAISAFIVVPMLKSGNNAMFDNNATTEYIEPFHSAQLGETVTTRDYSVCLSEYDYFEPNKHMMQEGNKYLKFYFTYTNTSNEKVYSNEEILCYDDTGKEYDDYIWLNDEDENVRLDAQNVMPNKSYSGWWYFELPETVNKVTITFGDSVEFNVTIQ